MEIKIDSKYYPSEICVSTDINKWIRYDEELIEKYRIIVEEVISRFVFEYNTPEVRDQIKYLIDECVNRTLGQDIRDKKIRHILDEQKDSQ